MSQKLMENAHKVAFLVKTYPDKKIQDIIALLLGWPEVHINAAIWYAVEVGLISDADKETGEIKFLKAPETWFFGDTVSEIQDAVLYCYRTNLVGRQYDLDEREMGDWLYGFPGCDVLVALNHLIASQRLATYTLVDPTDLKSVYTFYTLYENGEQMWGRSRFPNQQPTGAEKPETTNPQEGEKSE